MGSAERRRRLVWLIWARVVISTLLLGSATVFQINQPGSLPIDPFFFLIGLTYCLSVVYATTIVYVERWPWLADLQFLFPNVTRMLPIFSTIQVITSPGATGPTPAGVPVMITSPG